MLINSWGEVETHECFDVLLNAPLPDEQQQQQQQQQLMLLQQQGNPAAAAAAAAQQHSVSREQQLAQRDLQRLLRLLSERFVDFIVVGVRDRYSLLLQQIIKKHAIPKLSKKRQPFAVVLAPLEVAAIWAGSDRVPGALRRHTAREALMALSLGRFVQDPLAEAASLWGEGSDNLLLQLKLHPLQAALPRDRLAAACEVVMLRLVGACGVDLRRCMRMHSSTSSSSSSSSAALLQFVPGLGPRKAQRLLNMLKSSSLVMRSQLCMAEDSEDSEGDYPEERRRGEGDSKGLGRRVYKNCAAFLILKSKPSATDADALDALDATRIHPSDGSAWLARLCRDALEAQNPKDKEAKAAEEDEAIAEVLKDPSLLDNLDLEEFAIVLKDDPEGCRMLPYLEFMVSELRHPFRDRRLPFCPLSDLEVFYLATGETPEELREGTAVGCHVSHATGTRVYAHLKPSGIRVSFADLRELRGIMAARNKASCPEEEDLSPLIGEVLPARVLRLFYDVEMDRGFPSFRVLCVCTADAVKHALSLFCAENKVVERVSKFLSPAAPCDLLGTKRAMKFEREELMAGQQTQQLRRSRQIRHPNYKACSHRKALQLLQDPSVPLGEALFRPGSHRDGFVLMLKSCSFPFRALCLHVEEPSPAGAAGDPAAAAAAAAAAGQVGKELVLLGNTYDSFDQIIAVFCEPLRMNLEEIARHPKFRGCDIPTALKELQRESVSRPESISWCLLPPTSHAGNAADEKEGPAGAAGAAAAAGVSKRDNPLRFHLLVVPPKQKEAAKDVYFLDGVYVDSTSFRLWRHKEPSLRALIQWWKESGYWNRRQHLAEYAEEKQRLQAESTARRRDRELMEAQQQQQQQLQQQQQQYYVETAIQPRRDRSTREYVERAARAVYTPKIGGEVRQRPSHWGSSPFAGASQTIPAERDSERRFYEERDVNYRDSSRRYGHGDRDTQQYGDRGRGRRERRGWDERDTGVGNEYRDRDRDFDERHRGRGDSWRTRTGRHDGYH